MDRAYEIDGQNRVKTVHNYKTGANSSSNLTYDGNANLGHDGTASFTYDNDNRLVSGNGATLSYDPAGRLSQVSKGTVTRFLYDGTDIIGEYDSSGSTLLQRYVHGAGTDVPLVWYEGSGTGDRRSLLADERGSVVAVTNSSGTASINSYNEYGQPGATNQGRLQYTGQVWLAEVGVYHYKARAYSPSLGRFLQPDPIGYADGMNLYAYVGNDPVNRTDPTGTDSMGGIVVTGNRLCYVCWLMQQDLLREVLKNNNDLLNAGIPRIDSGDDGQKKPGPWKQKKSDTVCPVVSFTVTGVGPSQAPGTTAITLQKRGDIMIGGVAIKPANFGASWPSGSARTALPQVKLYADWSSVSPVGVSPGIPTGLPTQGPYTPVDVIGPKSVRESPGNHIDIYGYSDQRQAFASTRIVSIMAIIPGDAEGLECPKP